MVLDLYVLINVFSVFQGLRSWMVFPRRNLFPLELQLEMDYCASTSVESVVTTTITTPTTKLGNTSLTTENSSRILGFVGKKLRFLETQKSQLHLLGVSHGL
jgi:hypothetical protein